MTDLARSALEAITEPVDVESMLVQYSVERFLYAEAALLDQREYQRWYELFAPDVRYWAPTRRNRLARERDQENSGPGEVAIFDHDHATLGWRVGQLETGIHWAEDPPSRTRHLVSNVRVRRINGSSQVAVASNFLCYRNRLDTEVDIWAGERHDVLRPDRHSWLIAQREVILDQSVILSKNLSVFF